MKLIRVPKNRRVWGIRLVGGLGQMGLGVWLIIYAIRAADAWRNKRLSGDYSLDDLWINFYASRNVDAFFDICFWCPYQDLYVWGIWLLIAGLWLALSGLTRGWLLAAWGLFLGFADIRLSLGILVAIWFFQSWNEMLSLEFMNFLFSTTFTNMMTLISLGLTAVGVWLIARRFYSAKGSPSAEAETGVPD